MNFIKYTALFCVVLSIASVLFYAHLNQNAFSDEKQLLNLSSNSPKAQNIVEGFNFALESQKSEIFSNYVMHIQDRDQKILSMVDFTNGTQQEAASAACLFNGLAAICILILVFGPRKRMENRHNG